MTDITPKLDPLQIEQEPETMLRRIGWHPSDWAQIEVYARMSPARKVAQMLHFRNMQMRLLRTRLRQEHPDCTDAEFAQMIQEHLDLVRERPFYE
jgi:hypothetical protein